MTVAPQGALNHGAFAPTLTPALSRKGIWATPQRYPNTFLPPTQVWLTLIFISASGWTA